MYFNVFLCYLLYIHLEDIGVTEAIALQINMNIFMQSVMQSKEMHSFNSSGIEADCKQ